MKKEPEKKVIPIKYQCTFEVKAIAKFTETHCDKECQFLCYGHVNVLPINHIGICCASRDVLELDIRNNEFKRTAKCKDASDD
jgi:hypothetical protein